MQENASVSVRLNPFKSAGVHLPILEGATPVPWNGFGYILSGRPVFTLHPLFHAGVYYVQDSSAMYVGHVLRRNLSSLDGGKKGLRVLDLCAAPGGKTTDIAASLRQECGDDFLLVSNEVMKDRVRVLDDNVARWGDPNVVVTSVDPAAFASLPGFFDVIVADVPCSGEGMFRKDASAREQWSPAVVDLCAARQKRILADVWPSLREGGLLIYSTCTYEDAENDSNLEWAASSLGGEIVPPRDEFGAYGVRLTRCGYLLKVGEVPGEGQWVGALFKSSAQSRALSSDLSRLRPLRRGLVKGEKKGSDFVPCADWALSIAYRRGTYPELELDKQTALRFLHRDALVLAGAAQGYNVVTYKNVPLGFVKNIGNRCNNLHPKGRRILMDLQ